MSGKRAREDIVAATLTSAVDELIVWPPAVVLRGLKAPHDTRDVLFRTFNQDAEQWLIRKHCIAVYSNDRNGGSRFDGYAVLVYEASYKVLFAYSLCSLCVANGSVQGYDAAKQLCQAQQSAREFDAELVQESEMKEPRWWFKKAQNQCKLQFQVS